MGFIRVTVDGSFEPPQMRTFPAIHRGHAQAVADVIEWLSKDVLPRAIAQDHALQAEGAKPDIAFGNAAPQLDRKGHPEGS